MIYEDVPPYPLPGPQEVQQTERNLIGKKSNKYFITNA